jgi:hypothetical protein
LSSAASWLWLRYATTPKSATGRRRMEISTPSTHRRARVRPISRRERGIPLTVEELANGEDDRRAVVFERLAPAIRHAPEDRHRGRGGGVTGRYGLAAAFACP